MCASAVASHHLVNLFADHPAKLFESGFILGPLAVAVDAVCGRGKID